MRKRPSLRTNNGSIVVRVRIDGEERRIYRLGRWLYPVAVAIARAEAITAEIWSDDQQGDLDLSLNRNRPLVDGQDLDLIEALKQLMEQTKQGRVIHAYRPVLRFGSPLKTTLEVRRFVEWMDKRGLAVYPVHDPQHYSQDSTEEQGVAISGDQGANEKCSSGGSH